MLGVIVLLRDPMVDSISARRPGPVAGKEAGMRCLCSCVVSVVCSDTVLQT